MTGTRVTVHRIDADPVDEPYGSAFERAVAHHPSIDATTWERILSFLPHARLRTHASLNEKGWSSSSDLLCAIAECEAVSTLLDALPKDGWLDVGAQWASAESTEQARADSGEPTILLWRRPVVRLGAIIGLHEDLPLPHDTQERLESLFGRVMLLKLDANDVVCVVEGMPQDIEARIQRVMHPRVGVVDVSGMNGEKT